MDRGATRTAVKIDFSAKRKTLVCFTFHRRIVVGREQSAISAVSKEIEAFELLPYTLLIFTSDHA